MSAGTSPPCSLDERLGHADQRLRFLAEEAGGLDLLLELGRSRAPAPPRRDSAEQRRRDHVDARVGGLRRQDRGDQQLERVPVVQLGVGVRVLLGERLDDAPGEWRGISEMQIRNAEFTDDAQLTQPT